METEQKIPANADPAEAEDEINYVAESAEGTDNKTEIVKEKRDSTISFRVSKSQREQIEHIAGKCGMTLSDYVLSRAYCYEPKARLTPEQEVVREQLVIARSDYARYTSMLNAMPQDERRAMFRNQPWMIGTLMLLGRTADRITRVLKQYFAPNRIPSAKKKAISAARPEIDIKEEST